MNPKLEKILNLIRDKQNLNEEEKDTIQEVLKNIGKELELTSFKLERTEKVKKTTAILLEETIEELEQKRKAVEKQNRELEIEAALERVRARTMGMQKSDELKEVIQLVYEQFVQLNIHIEHTGFIMDYKARDDMNIWLADERKVPSEITIPYFDSPHWNSFVDAKEKGNDFFANNLNFEEKNRFYKKLFEYIPGIPEEDKKYYFECPGLSISTVLLDNVGLYIENFSGIPYSDEENKTLMRFGKVFQQTYTRFLDLQKAEEQAREAQIEAALERVRSKAMAMHSSDDLSSTVDTFFSELVKLNVVPHRCGVGIVDAETQSTYLHASTLADEGISKQIEGKLKLSGHPVLDKIFENWKKQEEYHPVLRGREIAEYYKVMNPQVTFPDFADDEVQFGYYFYFKEGGVFAWTNKKLREIELQIFRRYTSVLSLTYRRYIELKEAEAQTREAQIEAALERVRSKTMAMHKSDELADTAAVVLRQLVNLGIEPNRIYIAIMKDDTGNVEFWITDEDGSKVSSGFNANLNDNPTFLKMLNGWREQKKSIIIDMVGEELEEYFRHLSELNVPFKDGLKQDRRLQYIAYFSNGLIGIASPDETKPETLQLLERFAAVFNLTYTRFHDLLQAEEQNKIIQAENERKTKELEDARRLQLSMLPKELPELPHLDIAVYIKTATEVGGDYYDFSLDDNGTLTFIVGDATGHGMMSGMMVSIIKSFFISKKDNIELKRFFESTSNSLKDMKLGRLMMALAGVQFKGKKVIATNAGLPSLIYYRRKSGKAGEFVSHNLPLGAMKGIHYPLKEMEYEKGDTLLLMTDGYAEQVNGRGEMIGYRKTRELFGEAAGKNPEEIIEHLNRFSAEWIDGNEIEDDITFVVIKIK